MEDHRGMVLWRWRVRGTWVGWDVELHEGGNWDVGLCTGVGGSGGIDGSVGWMVLMVCIVVGVVVSTVIVQTVLVEVDCVGVVSESISRVLWWWWHWII